jgi:Ca2+-binding EF-hand superfamily protein
MQKIVATAALTMLALLGGGVAAAQADTKPADRQADRNRAQLVARLDAQFDKLDTNHDGFVSADERAAVRNARIARRFQRLDADRNGSISLAEMQAGHKDGGVAPGNQRGKRGSHGMRGGRGGGMHAWPAMDADKDGRISKAEFEARALTRFDRADTDRNSVLTAAERQASRAAMKAQHRR